MNAPRILALLSLTGLTLGPIAHAQQSGGGSLDTDPISCITQEDWARAAQGIARYQKNYGPLSKSLTRGIGPAPFTFYPMGGTQFGDVLIGNFADLLPGVGILTWECTDLSYDGHDAHDIGIRSFAEQAIGVPIYAVSDGVVIDTHDGESDMNTQALGQPANYVIIDHGLGRICYYWHMKTSSVAVSPSQFVRAGEQIGLVASSGNSTGPHLHFATYDSGLMVEPFTGPCNPITSLWVNQEPLPTQVYMQDFGVTPTLLGGPLVLPFELPRTSQIALSDTNLNFWFQLGYLQPNSTGRIRLYRPNGTLYFDAPIPFNNPSIYRGSWWWWSFSNPGILGTWRFVFSVDGLELIDAPFDIVTTINPSLNRPPEPITIGFEPLAPTASDVVICRVHTSMVLDDLDYDIVDYQYTWRVNGAIVRDITSAAHSDAIPHDIAITGNVLSCTVTPGDGTTTGPSATVSVTIGSTGDGSAGQSIWTDFAYTSFETGTNRHPVNTLAEATLHIAPGGTLNLKGNTGTTATPETLTISKPMTLQAIDGTIRLGSASR